MVREASIEKLIDEGTKLLDRGDFLNPLLDIQLLLCYTLDVDKIYLYTHKNNIVESENVDKFFKLVHLRKKGYPLQYIINKQEFMGLDFYVEEGVLVPRSDTEILVEAIINKIKGGLFHNKEKINIADICTGSGAIGLSLAYYLSNTYVYCTDISKKALWVAKKNSKKFDLEKKVGFFEGDLLKPLNDRLKNNLHIIVSNPPYIESNHINDLQVEVSKYEPRVALDGGKDGLDYYRRITRQSCDYLVNDGLIALEIGYNQAKEVVNLLNKSKNFHNIKVKKDLGGKDRVVTATYYE